MINRVALAKQGDNVLGSVRPSVCMSVRLSVSVRVQQRAKKGHYQSEEFVCVSNNRADAVDRLLMIVISHVAGKSTVIRIKDMITTIYF